MKLLNASVPISLLEPSFADTLSAPASGEREGLITVDVVLEGGRIASVSAADPGAGAGAAADVDGTDCGGGLLVPAFVDMHTHLDKGHIFPRAPNPNGTFPGALEATHADTAAHWSAQDVEARMEFALRAAYAHGTAAIRTHIDSRPPQDAISWPVFSTVRERWADRIALQGVSLMAVDALPDDLGPLFDRVGRHGGLVGAVLYKTDTMAANTTRLLEAAEDRGLDIDFHVDETLDETSNCLLHVASEARRIGFSGTITCGHCASLMVMEESEADRTLDAVAEAGLAIVSLPLCNLYLMDRDEAARRTPRIRGGTLVHEMAARGIRVALASDNTRDPFYAYGDLDMVEVWREATRVLHLDHPVGAWPLAVSVTPSAIMGLEDRDALGAGAPADLVLFTARGWSEFFARPQSDRTVIRAGKVIDAVPPAYETLDTLF